MQIQFSVREHFSLPVTKVFEGLTDLDACQHWMKGFVAIEKVKGTKVEPGAVWRESRKMFGKTATEEFEVLSVVPNKEIQLRVDGTKGTMKKGEFIFHYLLEEKNGSTEVTMNGKVNGLNGMSSFFFKLFAGSFKKSCAGDLQSLNAYLVSTK